MWARPPWPAGRSCSSHPWGGRVRPSGSLQPESWFLPAWLEQDAVRAASQSPGHGMKAETGDKYQRGNSPTLSLILRGQKLDYMGGWGMWSLVCLPCAKLELQYHAGGNGPGETTGNVQAEGPSAGKLPRAAPPCAVAEQAGQKTGGRWRGSGPSSAWGPAQCGRTGAEPLGLRYQVLPSLPTLPHRRPVDPIC